MNLHVPQQHRSDEVDHLHARTDHLLDGPRGAALPNAGRVAEPEPCAFLHNLAQVNAYEGMDEHRGADGACGASLFAVVTGQDAHDAVELPPAVFINPSGCTKSHSQGEPNAWGWHSVRVGLPSPAQPTPETHEAARDQIHTSRPCTW